MEEKICTKCGISKPQSEFFKDKQKKSGYRPDCKKCNSKVASTYSKLNREAANFRNIKYKTGVTKEMYFSLLEEQNNQCAICKCSIHEYNKSFSIDHCHSSNIIRGLLCNNCNLGLGYFKDNIEIIERAISYLNNNLSYKNIQYG